MSIRRSFFTGFLVFGLWSLVFGIGGCGPTYHKEEFIESIIKLCKNEYKADVKVEAAGKTIAIYVPLTNLIDFTFSVTKEASEKINDIILAVSRVALSTDAKFDFYCVIAHDIRIPEVQIVIIKSVDDVKRFLLNDISRGEYAKRMLIDIRLNPQSQKERAIKEVFEKMEVDKRWQEQVMNDFFRAQPTALSDIGYWNGHFYIKDITIPEFLAEEIASRIKIDARENKALADLLTVKSVGAAYHTKDGKRYFKFEVLVEPKWIKQFGAEEIPNNIFRLSLNVAAHVLHGYRFDAFDHVEIANLQDGRAMSVSREGLENFRLKKITLEDLMKGANG